MRRNTKSGIGMVVLATMAAVLVIGTSSATARPIATITVDAGSAERIDTPIWMSLDADLQQKLVGMWRLEETTGGKTAVVAAQIREEDGPQLCWILSGRTRKGAKRTFQVVAAAPAQTPKQVRINQTDDYLELSIAGHPVLRYNDAIVPPPPGQSDLYKRSAFIHPLWSPAGAVLTNIHPADHIHHMGFWMPWTHTEFEGKPVDFWNLNAGQGTVRFTNYLGTETGPVFGRVQTQHEHVVLNQPGGEKVALDETWDITVWNTGRDDVFIWDFVSTQRCAGESPLHLPAYRYGGMGFRATEQWKEGKAHYLTSEGHDRKTGHGTRARWCIVSGPTEQGDAGIVFMSHPENHEFPEPMRIWPSGDVFFNFCPVQENDWTLEPGRDYVFKYRLFLYNGAFQSDQAERTWQDFGNPPTVTVTR